MNNKSDYKIWRKDKPHLLTMQHATGISPSHDSAMHLLQVYGWLFLLGLNEPPPSNSYHHLKTWWHTMIEEGTKGGTKKIKEPVQKTCLHSLKHLEGKCVIEFSITRQYHRVYYQVPSKPTSSSGVLLGII
jgi:hypothetical protein